MKSKSIRNHPKQKYNNFEQIIKKISFNKHEKNSHFTQRKNKKLTGKSLLIAFIFMAMHGSNSFQLWAGQHCRINGKTVSKQAIWKRINARFVKFLTLILTDLLQQQIRKTSKEVKKNKLSKKIKRILVQDSTVITLPAWLSWCFPGNVSGGEKKSQLKIQAIYDLIADNFVYFEITPYTDNDQSKAKDILSIATSEDLVLRDLGYFTLDSLEKLSENNVLFISRLRYGINIYDCKTGKQINLLKQLKSTTGKFDQWVLIGEKKKVKVRLVVLRLPEEKANLKRRAAKLNRDKRLNHSKEYYQMLDYLLFITTEDQETFSPLQIAQIYQLRWRIEIIFKCWKSNFHIQRLIPRGCSLTKERTEAIIYMMLIFILLFQVHTYINVLTATAKIKDGSISLYKLCQFIADNIDLFFEHNIRKLLPQIIYYCKYDKRTDRKNFTQKLILS
ncbi:MAG: IS4 family transposase [Candidatus Hydrogenedentota bacterium]